VVQSLADDDQGGRFARLPYGAAQPGPPRVLEALGGIVADDLPSYGLRVTVDEAAAAAQRVKDLGIRAGEPVAILHPGKLGDIRTWPAARHRSLAASLREQGWTVAMEGPDRKRSRADRDMLQACVDDGALNLMDGLPLRELVAVLDHLARESRETGVAHVVVAPDTLLPHLAAAVGLPVVLLAGPQDPARTGPLGEKTTAVSAWNGLECAPCRKRRCHYDVERACMDNIEVSSVVGAVRTLTA